MELSELQGLIGTPKELYGRILKERSSKPFEEWRKQYEPSLHAITDKVKRPDKVITDDVGTSTVAVARLPFSIQKKIVHLAAAFLVGRPIKLHAETSATNEGDFLKVISKVWSDNKLDYLSQTIARHLFSETEVAEIWYPEAAEADYWNGTPAQGSKFRLRMRVVCNSKGDQLYPVFNAAGDLVAFGRQYYVTVGNEKENHFDLYTDKITYLGKYVQNDLVFTPETNVLGKIPVIYYAQEKPEWSDVQDLIERLENLASNHADTNDYFGSPMLKVAGKVEGLSKKGERGKVLEMENGADADYLSWDQSPKSVELEYNNLLRFIFDLTDTPQISFETMKGLGTFSGIALKMLFLGAHLKAAWHEENFGMSVQRRINLIKQFVGVIAVGKFGSMAKTDVKPVFEYYLPKNELEMVQLLSEAVAGKAIMSQDTAMRLNDLVTDKDAEAEKMKAEAESEGPLNENL